MVRTFLSFISCSALLVVAAGPWLRAQDQDQTTFHVKVDMVVLGFTVTDQKGKYVNGLRPRDFRVYEDEIL
ncbi:MAG: VWA domain-containing protein, partial [Acidobacteriaceae bacterium]|nr:VWA domain-containing protein [Acidobacteriaceae bacterium]